MDINRPTTPYWTQDASVPTFPSLEENATADVAIVGGGIAGLTTGYILAGQGLTVIIVDDGELFSGETERTTAHITAMMDLRYFELEQIHGRDRTEAIARSQRAAIDLIEAIIDKENIDCDFKRVNGYLFQAQHSDDADELEKEEEMLRELGFDASMVDAVPITKQPLKAIRVSGQARFHVLHYLSALARRITEMGGRIFNNTHIAKIEDGEEALLLTDRGNRIRASHIMIATNSPVTNTLAVHTKQAAYRSYVIGCQSRDDEIEDALYWDTDEPYHYIRLAETGDKKYLIIGGEDHKTGQEKDPYERLKSLEQWAKNLMPELLPVEFSWSGQIYEPVDGLAFIGRDPNHGDNVYIATGFSGVGMTQGTLSGMIVSDFIFGNRNEWSEVYDPKRKSLGSIGEYVKENLNMAAQYADHLTGSDMESIDEIAPGEGAVIKKVAVYKDEAGRVFQCSAVCPHLKALVSWNSLEKSWDCPAHGSRFDCLGNVIDGPANSNLPAAELSESGDEELVKPPLVTDVERGAA